MYISLRAMACSLSTSARNLDSPVPNGGVEYWNCWNAFTVEAYEHGQTGAEEWLRFGHVRSVRQGSVSKYGDGRPAARRVSLSRAARRPGSGSRGVDRDHSREQHCGGVVGWHRLPP